MVYTLTLNPALDYFVKTGSLGGGDIVRAESAKLFFGGKGLNVSAVLTRLGVENTALGFAAGFTGEKLKELAESEGINTDFVFLKNGETRINVKIRAERELDINAPGPRPDGDELSALKNKLEAAQRGDFAVFSGSVPEGVPADIYESLIKSLSEKGLLSVVDTEGEALLNTLKYRPFLVKPNHLELGRLFDTEIKCAKEAEPYALKLRELGAQNVLVTLAEKGALLADSNGRVTVLNNAPGKLINSTGCGDSAVAGFIAGYIKTKDYEYALRLAVACGNATAYSEGLAEKDETEKLMRLL